MSDSQNQRNARNARSSGSDGKAGNTRSDGSTGSNGKAGPSGNVRPPADPGHVRAREVTSARDAARSRGSGPGGSPVKETRAERLRRRARFLRERDEAQELRDRVHPRRTRTARMRQEMRMRTFRW